MSLGRKIRKGIKKAAKGTVRVTNPVASIVVDIAKGGNPVQAAKKMVKAPGEAVGGALEITGDVKSELIKVVAKAYSKVDPKNGEGFRRLLDDVVRLAQPLDERAIAGYINSINHFIDNGDVSTLNPVIGLVAGEIKRARDHNWDKAQPIPEEVVVKLPDAYKPHARRARAINVGKAGKLSIPSFAIDHLGRAGAIVMIDLIFFKHIPGGDSNEDMHLWLHEIVHLRQYQEKGLIGFVTSYIGNEFGFQSAGSLGNALEIEADRIACASYPIDNPKYLPSPCSAYP